MYLLYQWSLHTPLLPVQQYILLLLECSVLFSIAVYLRAPPEVCYERLKRRNRQEEAGVPYVRATFYVVNLCFFARAWWVKWFSDQLTCLLFVCVRNIFRNVISFNLDPMTFKLHQIHTYVGCALIIMLV